MTEQDLDLSGPDVLNLLSLSTRVECRKLIYSFANVLYKRLRERGVGDKMIRESIHEAASEFKSGCMALNRECMGIVLETMDNYIHAQDSGSDVLGRILSKFCFAAPGAEIKAHAPGTALDTKARKEFTFGVVPQPVLGYFLIVVRGSVPSVDAIESPSFLFGAECSYLKERLRELGSILDDHRIADMEYAHEADQADQAAPVNWDIVFKNRRTRMLALDLISEVEARVENIGLDKLHHILDNLHHKDKGARETDQLKRLVLVEDVVQLKTALQQARQNMEDKLRVCFLPTRLADVEPGEDEGCETHPGNGADNAGNDKE